MLSLPTLLVLLSLLPLLILLKSHLTNPLRKLPAAHPLARFTSLWILYIRYIGYENRTLKAAHEKYGPIVCLGPKEVSVNCVKGGIREVYAGGFEKGDPTGGQNGGGGYNWYGFFKNYSGVDNMFSTSANKPHSIRKRMFSHIYSKSSINSSPSLAAQTSIILYNRLLPLLSAHITHPQDSSPGILNIYPLLSASTMDFVTGYIFGLASSSDFLSNPKQLAWFLDLYNSRRSFNFWPQELPAFTAAVQKYMGYRLSPLWVDEANSHIEKWTKDMCEGARRTQSLENEGGKVEDKPIVYSHIISGLAKEAKKAGITETTDFSDEVASEVLDHLAAGFDTSGITLVYVIHELSTHPEIQRRLQTELTTLSPPLLPSSAPAIPDAKAVDTLPLLHAVIWETLRLHSAIPGAQPRFTPVSGCQLGPEEKSYYIPGGVRVSASAGLLHQNENVYERAGEWRPDRWLEQVDEEKRKDMESRWFWAFGSGGRMCVGSHLAVYQMKYIVATLYSNYTTTIISDTNISQIDAYTAPPKSEKLLIKLHPQAHVKAG
ncbi:cytochrome P450 [Amniculicola lignicola CBS 123094]|uniref:Cytochrome P450 n=1 Tax=Amniculicola lignicola CBS 123094 TaxID=1392246 RepID=A0A6A5WIZ4_9PLEO|nr:cytochrome P450 [Amniculicola lignicola CBS 123094]